jgi:hypothetical protein
MSGLLESIAEKQDVLAAAIAELGGVVAALSEKVEPVRQVYSLADLAALPESPSLKTLRNNQARQPKGGKDRKAGEPDGYRGREKCWYRETVEAWRRELASAPAGGVGFARRSA